MRDVCLAHIINNVIIFDEYVVKFTKLWVGLDKQQCFILSNPVILFSYRKVQYIRQPSNKFERVQNLKSTFLGR